MGRMLIAVVLGLVLGIVDRACGQNLAVDLPTEQRVRFRNPDGSCVQCSIGMLGVHQNVPAAEMLLWRSEYGPAERGGSGPSRVARYCRERGIKVYNITGSQTWDWMRWACATNRGAAIGAGTNHFQTLVGHDPQRGLWYVCNNNSPTRIDTYDEAAFKRLHLAIGQWIVVLDYPAPAKPPATKFADWK